MEKKSEADWAYTIIEEKGGPVFYRDLIEEIIKRMNKPKDAKTMASIYTRINIDNRLNHIGEGYWVLREQ
ncbi:MAG: DNA-directed RNA polymerase subunit delta [Syntrophomonadales bacterium]|jgi:DNA-directed RNA polymerase subunit delta